MYKEKDMDIRKMVRENLINKKTKLISAFPGTGKSYFYKNTDKKVLDSDSSTFDKSDFPKNYIEHIKKKLGKVDIILISSHKEVRDALVDENLDFTLVYPNTELKDEYLERYEERGNEPSFIKMLDEKWTEFLTDIKSQDGCKLIELKSGEFLSDVI